MKAMKTIYAITALAGMALMGMQSASADVTAVYRLTSPDGNGTQTIRYIDKQHVRVDMDDGKHEVAMLKLGDKVYSINGKTVRDMSQVAKMMAMMGQKMGSAHARGTHASGDAPIKYEDTGRTETIAGITGNVYHFVDAGKQHEAVIGTNKDLQAAFVAFIGIFNISGGQMPFGGTNNRIQRDASGLKSMAMLRMDNRMRLQSMNTRSIPQSMFTLPTPPQQMPDMGMLKGVLGR